MATVRREGDWRLEKKSEGVYEVTYRKDPQLKILTSDAPTGRTEMPLFDTVPVREVASYSEAEGLFEEKAHGPSPHSMGISPNQTGSSRTGTSQGEFENDIDLSELPPGGIGAAFLIAGILILYMLWNAGNDYAIIIGLGFTGFGVLILAYGLYLFRTEGWEEGWRYLTDGDYTVHGSSSTNKDSTPDKTPPAPQSLKNELFFGRADRHCEYCGVEFNQPDVHHIKPRSEGGPNTRDNLIVLCPNCHRKADSGVISQSKLKYKLNNG